MFAKEKKTMPAQGEQSISAPSVSTYSAGRQARQDNPTSNGAYAVLLAARDELSGENLPRALHTYHHLIQRGKLLDEVLPDLAQVVKKYPHDPQAWQMLGEALARAGDSVHATQSYTQARKLMNYESF
jgi:predicted Zn-dependent protease